MAGCKNGILSMSHLTPYLVFTVVENPRTEAVALSNLSTATARMQAVHTQLDQLTERRPTIRNTWHIRVVFVSCGQGTDQSLFFQV